MPPSTPSSRQPRRSIRTLVRELENRRIRHSPEDLAAKLAIVRELEQREIRDPRLLFRYHEALLFLRAYPDDERLFRLVERACRRTGDRALALREHDPDTALELDDTGLNHTAMHYRYEYPLAEWLAGRFGERVEIEWDLVEDTAALEDLIALGITWTESDGFEQGDITTEEWLTRRRGERRTSLRWFLQTFRRSLSSPLARQQLYNRLDLPLVWHIGAARESRTRAGVSGCQPYFHPDGLLREAPDLAVEVRRPMPGVELLDLPAAREAIRMARAAVCTRHRSFYPFENPNVHEVYRADVGRGYQFFIFGVQPGVRLPLETDYGGLIIKNGYVIGYAVGAFLFDQVELAVNVYDTWRGGEAKFIFPQFMRLLHTLLGSRHFKIDRYQVGYQNEEGLQSGSFWFYYNLGFVPALPEVREMAARERARVRSEPGYRTPVQGLRQLCVSDLYFSLGRQEATPPTDFPLAEVGLAVTRMIGERYGGDGDLALRDCGDRVARLLRCRGRERWTRDEQTWFRRLSLPVSLIPDLERWPPGDRRTLRELMRGKGALQEADYARLMVGHRRLRRGLLRVAREEATRAARGS